ncbi:MAG TPA: RNA polymerase factor sigma-54 [Candidatus Sabulitectum sp.]|nr:RNA polymerase factor sigma-54 [Candidatus Sabulitectum sp.]HPF31620.1 RNA polymerase factor sigma-54 [Candidatus Sabulitectum sp.]HPJ28146.1 RNA polymerase factor sigma-54 [Candidatus Sabulitectum sp.]HPR21812.1 RNA polymerase factor sigma-54 [Candidatus Sabulitectum sp.]
MPELRTQLRLTQTQKLAMTQTLRQQLEILQIPSMELEGLIATELAENPLLEVEGTSSDKTEGDTPDEDSSADEEPERDDAADDDPLDILKEIDEDLGNTPSTRYTEEERWHPEAVKPVTLSEHLLSQLDTMDLDQDMESAAVYIIYSLDRHGLLNLDDTELQTGWGGDPKALRDALTTVRTLDPPGVAQGSARQALLFQLRRRYGEDAENTLEYLIIDRCFNDLAERRIPGISAELGVTPHQVEEAVSRIRTLNPWPGAEFAGGEGAEITPDVIIENHDGRFLVFLNDDRFPHLTISSRNRRILESPSAGKVEKEYVKKKFKKASWFIRAIRQRQETVTRIAEFIARKQEGFLLGGVDHLVPLTLQEAAEALGYNQSTISRAINGKYVQSPQGVHEMRYYFSRGSSDSSVAAESVREEIRRIIAAEDRHNPLSDEKIAEILESGGTAIKRRTVANYRKQMDIPGARKRRRF